MSVRLILAGLALAMAVPACTPVARDDLARGAARNAIRPVVARHLPGVPVEPAIDCLLDNASADEIFSLAADAVTGPTASTTQIVTTIAARPGTLRCLATDGLTAFQT